MTVAAYLIEINNIMKSLKHIMEDVIDDDMRDTDKRRARLKAEVEAGMVPGIYNASSNADPVYTMGDLEALGWMSQTYTHDSSGEVDGWERDYFGPKPVKILNRAGRSRVLNPGDLLD